MPTLSEPLFSIIIPTFNRAATLVNAIESVINQSFVDLELIIVDDGSTDKTSEVVGYIEDDRIKYFYQQNEDLSGARNTGVRHARGQFICFLDDDDAFAVDHLFKLKFEISNTPNADRYIFRNSLLVCSEGHGSPGIEWTGHDHPVAFIWDQFVGITSFAFPRKVFDRFLFPKQFKLFEDKHFLCRALLTYSLIQVKNSPTVIYNVNENSRSHTAYKDDVRIQNYVGCVKDLFSSHGVQLRTILGDNAENRKIALLYYQVALRAREMNDFSIVKRYLKLATKLDGRASRRLRYWKLRLGLFFKK